MATKPLKNARYTHEFYDALSDVILGMKTEDIRAEMQSEGLDPDAEVRKTRGRLMESLARSRTEDIKDAAGALLRKTARAVSDIVSLSVDPREKRHMLEATFAKASQESQINMDKVVAALDGLSEDEKRALRKSLDELLSKD